MKEQIIKLIKSNSPEEATDKILKLVVKADVMPMLPSDKKIFKYSEIKTPDIFEQQGFRLGAKWMRKIAENKLKGNWA